MYDPLIDSHLPADAPPPRSYWRDTAAELDWDNPLTRTRDAEVAIIGGGNTGLSTAWHLAKDHGIGAVVLEAGSLCSGASGRNAGFLLPGSGRLSWPAMIGRYGSETARQVYAEYRQAVETASGLADLADDGCDRTTAGYLRIAHSEQAWHKLNQTAECLARAFQDKHTLLSSAELRHRLPGFQGGHGALLQPAGQGVHPLKLSQTLARQALQVAAAVHTRSPVIQWRHHNGWHQLRTPQGLLRARKLALATNGYTPDRLFPVMQGRLLPVLSSILVTRPLTEDEMQLTGLRDGCVMMDTRALKYYYRLLPDNRLLFGGRGALSGRQADSPAVAQRLLRGLQQTFPALSDIHADYQWSGWIAISWDDIPHVCQADGDSGIYYSSGYCGSGQAFAIQAGKRLAEAVAANGQAQLPAINTPLPRFPLAPLRRLGQALFYQVGRWQQR